MMSSGTCQQDRGRCFLVLEEPYRVFFPLGIFFGFLGAGHWIFYALGWIPSYSIFFHASVQTQGYISCFVLGFLLTALPRFSSTFPVTAIELGTFLFFMVGSVFSLLWGQRIFAESCFMGWILLLIRFVFVRLRRRKVSGAGRAPAEFVWIPMALFFGLSGALLLIVSQVYRVPVAIQKIGVNLIHQGFLLAIVLGVGGFLAPRLMGTYQPAEKVSIFFHLAAGLFLFSSFALEGLGYQIPALGLRALVVTVGLVGTRTLVFRPKVTDQFVWFLWASFWMVFLGQWAAFLFPKARATALHLSFIGGYTLLTFAVGTMVILTHGGGVARLRRASGALSIVGIALSAALVLRIGSVFYPDFYFSFLRVSAAAWMVAAVSWLTYVLPWLFRVPAEAAFERSHEEAKQRVLNVRRKESCCSGEET